MTAHSIRITGPRPAPGIVSRLAGANERLVLGVVGLVGLTSLWELAADSGLYRRSLLSAPSSIWKAAVEDAGSGTIWPHLIVSFNEFALGFLAALAIGIPLGFGIGLVKRVDYFASVLLSGIYSTPKVALVPLIIIVAGIGLAEKVVVVFLLAVFAVVLSTVAGVRSVSEKHLDITRSFGASRWLTFRAVVLPSTFPFILSGIRIASGRALVGVVVAELLAANEGIGYYIGFWGSLLDTSRVMLGIVVLGTFGIVTGELVRLLERRFERWRPELRT